MGAGERNGVKMERGVESLSHPSGVHPIHTAYTLLMPTSFSALPSLSSFCLLPLPFSLCTEATVPELCATFA